MTPAARILFAAVCCVAAGPPAWAADKPAPGPDDARQAALLKAGYAAVPLAVEPNGLLTAAGTVGAEKVKFLIDAAGDLVMLDEAVAKKLKLELGEAARKPGLGGALPGRVVTLPGLAVGPVDATGDAGEVVGLAADLSGYGHGITGVLGTHLLDPFGAVIDYPNKALYLRPPTVTVCRRAAGAWAVTSWKEDGADRKLDPKTPPTLTFADQKLTLADGGTTREFLVMGSPGDGADQVLLFDPKAPDGPAPRPLAGGLVRVKGGAMTACLFLDAGKVEGMPAEFAAPKGSGYVLLELTSTTPAAGRPPLDPLREVLVKDGFAAVPLERTPGGERVVTAKCGAQALRLAVATAASVSLLDAAAAKRCGARLGEEGDGQELGGNPVKFREGRLRGFRLGGYDTRAADSVVIVSVADLAGAKKARAAVGAPPLDGTLARPELANGSAVIDFHANTLYLRPLKKALEPHLRGKWVGVAREQDGAKAPFPAGEAPTLEFKDGRYRLTTAGRADERGFHVWDSGDHYRLSLFDPKADELADNFKYTGGGIFKLAGDRLTVVLAADPAKPDAEPDGFAAPKGSGLLLIEFERAK